jgi:pilus assembly protein CpaE
MPSITQINDAPGSGGLSVALIGPDEMRLREVAGALAGCKHGIEDKGPAGAVTVIREFTSYPPDLDHLPKMFEHDYDVVVIDLDSDPEIALNVVRGIAAHSAAAVMVYSARSDDVDLVVRSMRAGAREFLNLPLSTAVMAEALARVAVQRPAPRHVKKAPAKRLLVFLGAKGGCGVTTVASNFAVALAQESGQNTLLIDLGVPLGDVAINLGMIPKYSTANAFQDSNRLDWSFLSSLLAKHSSGLSVLAAPSDFVGTQSPNGAVDKLLNIARQNFEYVVIDAGSRVDLKGSAVFDDTAIIYLVTQVGVTELRNANRMISQLFAPRINTLQIVLNRYVSRALGFDEEHITKALTRPAQWRIPDDYPAARRTQNTAIPLALEDSPISRAIRQMARSACGLTETHEKKKRFGLFG